MSRQIRVVIHVAAIAAIALSTRVGISESEPESPLGGEEMTVDTSAPKGEEPSSLPAEQFLGQDVCQGCHQVETEHWTDTVHARAFQENPRNALERRMCEACHGPGGAHIASPSDKASIVSFTRGGDRPVEELNSICLKCHAGGPRIHWAGSIHESEDLACSDCHNPMSRTSPTALLRESSVHETCFSCHPAQRADFKKRSHMPLLEGKIDCDDCHAAHGSAADALVRAASNFELCTNCHPDKRGPFIWEHAPVVEDCMNCHLPHGSNRLSLLSTSPPFLCQQCHAQIGLANHPIELLTTGNLAVGSPPEARDPRIIGRGCVTCHAQIHGSNHPSGARFHR